MSFEDFDKIINLEETIYQKGFEQGQLDVNTADRNENGFTEGFWTGFSQGVTLGFELGFYESRVGCKNSSSLICDQKNSRHLINLAKKIEKYPRKNQEDAQFASQLSSIRSMFKIIDEEGSKHIIDFKSEQKMDW